MSTKAPDIPAFVIALTGGIASGKTAVSDTFSSLGAAVVDTDIIAREVVLPGSTGLRSITETFGSHLVNSNGELDRQALRHIIFTDPGKRKLLESILHPLIRAQAIQQLQAVDTALAILVIPLLAEAKTRGNHYQWVDRILLVDVHETTQIERLMARDHIDSKQARAILNSQASRQQRLKIADDVLINDKDLPTLTAEVAKLYNKYMQLASD